jgi:hypothetical protein
MIVSASAQSDRQKVQPNNQAVKNEVVSTDNSATTSAKLVNNDPKSKKKSSCSSKGKKSKKGCCSGKMSKAECKDMKSGSKTKSDDTSK